MDLLLCIKLCDGAHVNELSITVQANVHGFFGCMFGGAQCLCWSQNCKLTKQFLSGIDALGWDNFLFSLMRVANIWSLTTGCILPQYCFMFLGLSQTLFSFGPNDRVLDTFSNQLFKHNCKSYVEEKSDELGEMIYTSPHRTTISTREIDKTT